MMRDVAEGTVLWVYCGRRAPASCLVLGGGCGGRGEGRRGPQGRRGAAAKPVYKRAVLAGLEAKKGRPTAATAAPPPPPPPPPHPLTMSTSSSSFSQPARPGSPPTPPLRPCWRRRIARRLSSLTPSSQLSHAWTRAARAGRGRRRLHHAGRPRGGADQRRYWRPAAQHVAKVADIDQVAVVLEGNVQYRRWASTCRRPLLSWRCWTCSRSAQSAPTSRGEGGQLPAARHTDAQFVFVLQTSGAKRCRVYAPPPPPAARHAPPGRGKYEDTLEEEELGTPLLRTPARAACSSPRRAAAHSPFAPSARSRPGAPPPPGPVQASTRPALQAAKAAAADLSARPPASRRSSTSSRGSTSGRGGGQRLAAAPPLPPPWWGRCSPRPLTSAWDESTARVGARASPLDAVCRPLALGGEIAGEIEDSGLASDGDTLGCSPLSSRRTPPPPAPPVRLYRTVAAAPPPQPSPPDARTPPNGATAAAADVLAAAAAGRGARRQRAWRAEGLVRGVWRTGAAGRCAVHPDGMRQECPGACTATLPSDADAAAAASAKERGARGCSGGRRECRGSRGSVLG